MEPLAGGGRLGALSDPRKSSSHCVRDEMRFCWFKIRFRRLSIWGDVLGGLYMLSFERRYELLPMPMSMARRTLRWHSPWSSSRFLCAPARPLATTPAPDAYLLPNSAPSSTSLPALTVCLDLDDCLIHSTNADVDPPSFRESSGPEAARAKAAHSDLLKRGRVTPTPDHEFDLPYLEFPVRVYKRPLLDDFLAEASKLCELVLFSSAVDGYVRECAGLLDPDGTRFGGRLLSRVHCTPLSAVLAKDLGRLGRPLERVVLVDDNVASCMLQPDNAVPVRPFFGDADDRELGSLLLLLRRLRDHSDVRTELRASYQLQEKLLSGVRGWRESTPRI